MVKFNYDSVEGDYQYKAMNKGPRLQRFWHKYKITLANNVIPLSKEDVILDMGCGSGNILLSLSKRVKKAYGADISQKALDFIKKRAINEKIKNIELVKISPNKRALKDNYFDKVIMSEVIEHLENPDLIIKECYRVLKPNGILFVTTPNYRSFWPILETLSDIFKMTPKMRGEQYISKFNKPKLKKILKKSDFKVMKVGTFYTSSPFLSILSSKIADWAFKFETKHEIIPGMLIYALAKK